MTPLEITRPPEFEHSFLEMALLEEMIYHYDAETIESLISQGETSFPDEPFFPAIRAFPYIVHEEYEEATEWLDRASELGDHFIIHCLRADISEHNGFWFEAEQHYKLAIERYPNIARVRREYANYCFRRKYYDEACLHMTHYVRIAGFTEDSTRLLLTFFEYLDEYSVEMTQDLKNLAVDLLHRNHKNALAHAHYAIYCHSQYRAVVRAIRNDIYYDIDLDGLLFEIHEHWLHAAIYATENSSYFKKVFFEQLTTFEMPETVTRFYYFRFRMRYYVHRYIFLLKKWQ